MDWFKIIKNFYPKYWSKDMVRDAVIVGKINELQYSEIVGEDYED